MKRALQVLRIHMLELEKVHELCTDFCARYIACLKHKMQCENVLRNENGGYDSDEENGYLNLKNQTREVQATTRPSQRHYNNMAMMAQQVKPHQTTAISSAKMTVLHMTYNKDAF